MISRRASQILALATVALASSLLGASGAQAKHAKSKAPAPAAECKHDSDCVAVPDDCCSCHQGGKQHAILKKDEAQYEKERHKRCASTACADVMSEDPSCAQKPFCAAGICELADAAPTP